MLRTNSMKTHDLNRAIEHHQLDEVQKALTYLDLREVNNQDQSGNTYLHVAIDSFDKSEDSIKIIDFILKMNPNINIQNSNGKTSFHLAIEKGIIFVVKELIDRGADFTIKDNDGNTVLHLAAKYEDTILENKTVLEYSKDKGNIKTEISEFLVKLLLGQINNISPASSPTKHKDIKQYLGGEGSKNKSSIEVKDVSDSEKHKSYIARHPIIYNENSNGRTLDIDALDKDGNTLAHIAVKKGMKDIIDLLSKKGANLEILDEEKNSVLHYMQDVRELSRICKSKLSLIENFDELADELIKDLKNTRDVNASACNLSSNKNTQIWQQKISKSEENISAICLRSK